MPSCTRTRTNSSIPGRTHSPEPPFDETNLTRGNATKVTRLVSGSGTISSYTRYDVLGNVVSAKDPLGNVATIDYLDDFGTGSNPGLNTGGHSTYALPTKIMSPLPNPNEPQQTAYSQYDFSTGLLTGFKDRNLTITQSFYNDPFDRPTQVIVGLGATSGTPPVSIENHTAMYYAPQTNPFGITLTNNDVLTAKDQVSLNDGNLRSWTKTDGFGRTIESWTHAPDELYQGNPVSGDIVAKVIYDGLGRTKQTGNPLRPAVLTETAQYTTTAYDRAGRVTTVTTPDNAVVSTAYDGPRVLVQDQAGKERLSKTDGLGRLTDVWEIRSTDPVTGTEPVTFPNHSEVQAGYRTKYSYDALDDLTQAAQQIGTTGTTQTRTFAYDGLKRLISALNPENGTVSYTYDDNSNLHTKTDSRVSAVTTTYEYDALNRVKSRGYSDSTLAVAYKYDAQQLPPGAPGTSDFDRGYSTGRLVAVNYGGTSAGNYTGYDRLGRANVSVQQTDSQNYRFTYGYNLATEMTTESYPSGRAITTGYDVAGRILQLGGTKTGEQPKTYASQFTYAAHGAVAAMQLGNSKLEHTSFNNRLQPTLIGLGTSSSDSSILRLDYGYGTANNSGNVLTQTIAAPGLTLNECYGYDSLNRLSTAEERSGGTTCAGTQQWKQAFIYDRYGNRNFDVANTTPNVLSLPANPTISQTNNRFTAGQNYGYDGAGNLTSDPATSTNGIVYDAENRQTQYTKTAQPTNYYYYDGDGRRVKKIDNTGTTVFVYNAGGQLIAEYISGTPSGGGTSYLTSDHLGSTRVVMKSDGSVARYDYLPFGEEISSTIGGRGSVTGYGAADTTRQKFTQKERDSESGLDYFLARYYSSAQGRFTSPDDIRNDSHVGDPQSWNRYAYVRNNPLHYIDPTGKDANVAITTDEEHKKGTITIHASFAIWTSNGSGITAAQMQRAAAEIKQTIEGAWKGSFEKDGIKYDVKTEVSVIVAGSEKAAEKSAANAIEMVSGSASATADSYVNNRSFLGGPDTGKWNINSLIDSVAAHEFTHLLSVRDRDSGAYLSNTNMLNDPFVPRHATADDFRWALGSAIDAHRWESRPNVITGNELETRSSPGFSKGAPASYQSTRNVHAGTRWWGWR
jgi:RHS repeat-associated protein